MVFTTKALAELGIEKELIDQTIGYRITLPDIRSNPKFLCYTEKVIDTITDDSRFALNDSIVRVIGNDASFFRYKVNRLTNEALFLRENYKLHLERRLHNSFKPIKNACIVAGIAAASYLGYNIENFDNIKAPFHIKLLCASGGAIIGFVLGTGVGELIECTLDKLIEKHIKSSYKKKYPLAFKADEYVTFRDALKKSSIKKEFPHFK